MHKQQWLLDAVGQPATMSTTDTGAFTHLLQLAETLWVAAAMLCACASRLQQKALTVHQTF
jgi:hypothetical protein